MGIAVLDSGIEWDHKSLADATGKSRGAQVVGAVATGVVVVAAAGNAGKSAAGAEVYGSIGSPGHEPSVITVGASDVRGTAQRSDDVLAGFSSRGPTRGSVATGASGARRTDKLLKPDLVAPGKRMLGAASNLRDVAAPAGNALAGANLLQQGAGQLNVDGAVRLAQALRKDIGSALAAGTLRTGDNLLANGASLPAMRSTLNGENVDWGRIAFAGGSHLVSGDALFTHWQPIYDPRLTWVRQVALRSNVAWLPAGVLVAANTVPVSVVETNATAQTLLTPQVVLLDGLAGSNSAGLASGVFTPIALLASRAAAGAGKLLSGGLILSEGFILSESADPASLGDASLLGQP